MTTCKSRSSDTSVDPGHVTTCKSRSSDTSIDPGHVTTYVCVNLGHVTWAKKQMVDIQYGNLSKKI